MRARPVLRGVQSFWSWATFAFLLLPILSVVYVSFSAVPYFAFPPHGFSLQWYRALLQNQGLIDAFLRSIYISVIVVIVGSLLSVPAALGLARARGRWVESLVTFFLGPLLLPELVLGLGLLQLYSLLGWVDTLQGVVIAQTVVVIPFMMRSLLVSTRALDPHLGEVSRLLGAGPLTTFLRVTLPLIRPGILAASVFSFIVAFNQFTVTLFLVSFHEVTLPIAIFNFINNQNNPTAAAISVVTVLFGVISMIGVYRLFDLTAAVGVGTDVSR